MSSLPLSSSSSSEEGAASVGFDLLAYMAQQRRIRATVEEELGLAEHERAAAPRRASTAAGRRGKRNPLNVRVPLP